jgi:hypothetical protein
LNPPQNQFLINIFTTIDKYCSNQQSSRAKVVTIDERTQLKIEKGNQSKLKIINRFDPSDLIKEFKQSNRFTVAGSEDG